MLHTSEDYLCTNLHISAPVSLNDSPAIPNPETVYTRFFSSHDTSMESVFNSTVFGLVSFELRGIQATEERKSARRIVESTNSPERRRRIERQMLGACARLPGMLDLGVCNSKRWNSIGGSGCLNMLPKSGFG
jgi:hypothetical protein